MPETVIHKHLTKPSEKSLSIVLILFVPIFVFALLVMYLYMRNNKATMDQTPQKNTLQNQSNKYNEFEETVEYEGEEIPAPRM